MAVSPAGNVYAAGDFTEELHVGDDIYAATAASDAFVVSYASDGTHRWTEWIPGDGNERARSIAVTACGEVLVAGYCDDTVDFGAATNTCSPTRDAFVLKFAPP